MIRAILSRLWPNRPPSPADTILAVEQERARLIRECQDATANHAKIKPKRAALNKATEASLLAAVGWF